MTDTATAADGRDQGALAGDAALANDLLEGCGAIAAFIGASERRTFYLIERGQIPAGRQGCRLIASKARLRAFYQDLTGGALAAAE